MVGKWPKKKPRADEQRGMAVPRKNTPASRAAMLTTEPGKL
jgi:hypothetical protein